MLRSIKNFATHVGTHVSFEPASEMLDLSSVVLSASIVFSFAVSCTHEAFEVH